MLRSRLLRAIRRKAVQSGLLVRLLAMARSAYGFLGFFGVKRALARHPILDMIVSVRHDLKPRQCAPEDLARTQVIADRIRRHFAAHRNFKPAREEYQLGRYWARELSENSPQYSLALEGGEGIAELLCCFHRTDAISGIGPNIRSYLNIFYDPIRSASFVTNMITKYQALTRLVSDRILQYMDESITGCPVVIPFNGRRLTLNAIRHTYYASELSGIADLQSREQFIILEVGAGYGNLARILKSAFSDKHFVYVIVDLPQMLPIVSYFLNMNFPNARFGWSDDLAGSGGLSAAELLAFDFVFLPTWDIERVNNETVDVVINTGSLPEMDPAAVKNYLEQFQRLIKPEGCFYTVNRHSGGSIEFGMDSWSLNWPGWRLVVDRQSWGDMHWGLWENMDMREVAMVRDSSTARN